MKKNLILLTVLTALFISASSQAVIIDRVLAIVNDDIITVSEVQEMEQSLRSQGGGKQLDEIADLNTYILNKMIDKKLQLQLADKKQITVSDEQVKAALEDIKKQNGIASDEELRLAMSKQGINLEKFKDELKDNIKITILLKREVNSDIQIKEEEIKKYYEENKIHFSRLNEFRAQHILFYLPVEFTPEQKEAKKQLAEKALEELKNGADFAELAKKYSDDPSAEKGGDLGYFRRGEMLPVIEEAAEKLTVGNYSGIIETSFGFHIIKLTEFKEHTLENDSKIREEISEILFQEKSEDQMKKWMEKIRKQAKITILK